MLLGLLLTTTGCVATEDECEPGALGCTCLAGAKCNDNQTCRWSENDPISESVCEYNPDAADIDPNDPCGAKSTMILEALDTIPAGFNFTVEQVLRGMEGDYVGTLQWNPPDPLIEITHAGTTAALTMSLRYQGGEIRLETYDNPEATPDSDGGRQCGSSLFIDVALTFATDDGAFAEQWPVTLSANSHSWDGPYPTMAQPLHFGELNGTLTESDITLHDQGSATYTLDEMVLIGSFPADLTANGLISVTLSEYRNGQPSGALGTAIASWNAEAQ
jgi:hypothetical protein